MNNPIEKLIIPSSVKRVGELCFYDCSINELSLSKVEEVGNMAFSGNKIEKLVIPNDMIMVGEYAFTRCAMKELTILSDYLYVSKRAFTNNSIESIEGMDAVGYIGESAFRDNSINYINLINTEVVMNNAFKNNPINRIELGHKIAKHINDVGIRGVSTFGAYKGFIESVNSGGTYVYKDNSWKEEIYW